MNVGSFKSYHRSTYGQTDRWASTQIGGQKLGATTFLPALTYILLAGLLWLGLAWPGRSVRGPGRRVGDGGRRAVAGSTADEG